MMRCVCVQFVCVLDWKGDINRAIVWIISSYNCNIIDFSGLLSPFLIALVKQFVSL